MKLLVDVAAFLGGYAVISRWLTGGGIVDPRAAVLYGPTFETRTTVAASVAAGLLVVLLWRTVFWLSRRTRHRGSGARRTAA
jgi:hypothetical protein